MSRFLIFVTTVLLMLGAGIVLGRLSTRVQPLPATRPTTGPAWFDEQLNLSTDQKKQMDSIWSDTRQKMEKLFERQRGLEADRDKQIKDLLTEEQRTKYDAIRNSYREKRDEFEKDFSALRADADKRSRALLNDTQLKRWDELQKAREGHRRGGPRGPRGASTKPTTEPSHRLPPPDGIRSGTEIENHRTTIS